MKKMALALIVASLCLAAHLGCKKDDDGGSSVPDSKKMTELTPEEEVDLCEETAGVLNKAWSAESICTVNSSIAVASAKGDKAACEQAVQECIKAMGTGDRVDCSDTSTDTESKEESTCDATVGEFRSCVNAIGAYFDDQNSKYNCDNVATIDATKAQQEAATSQGIPDSCNAIETKCPGFFGGEDASEAAPIDTNT